MEKEVVDTGQGVKVGGEVDGGIERIFGRCDHGSGEEGKYIPTREQPCRAEESD